SRLTRGSEPLTAELGEVGGGGARSEDAVEEVRGPGAGDAAGTGADPAGLRQLHRARVRLAPERFLRGFGAGPGGEGVVAGAHGGEARPEVVLVAVLL